MSKTRKINGIFFKAPNSMTEEEVLAYKDYVIQAHPHWNSCLAEVIITLVPALVGEGEEVQLEYHFKDIPFERIRRITGYLVGTTDRWNDAKRKELNDRVTHGI